MRFLDKGQYIGHFKVLQPVTFRKNLNNYVEYFIKTINDKNIFYSCKNKIFINMNDSCRY